MLKFRKKKLNLSALLGAKEVTEAHEDILGKLDKEKSKTFRKMKVFFGKFARAEALPPNHLARELLGKSFQGPVVCAGEDISVELFKEEEKDDKGKEDVEPPALEDSEEIEQIEMDK